MAELIFIGVVVVILIYLVYRVESGVRKIQTMVARNGENIQTILKHELKSRGISDIENKLKK